MTAPPSPPWLLPFCDARRVRPAGWAFLFLLYGTAAILRIACWTEHPAVAETLFVGSAADMFTRGEARWPWELTQEPYALGPGLEAMGLALAHPLLGERLLAVRVLGALADLVTTGVVVGVFSRLSGGPTALLVGLALVLAPGAVADHRYYWGVPHARQWLYAAPALLALATLRDTPAPRAIRRSALAAVAGLLLGLGCAAYLLFGLVALAFGVLAASGWLGPLRPREIAAAAAGFALGLSPLGLALEVSAVQGAGADPGRFAELVRFHLLSPQRLLLPIGFPAITFPLPWDVGAGSTALRAALALVVSVPTLACAVRVGRSLARAPRPDRASLPLAEGAAVVLIAVVALFGLGPATPPFTTLPGTTGRYAVVLFPGAALLAARVALDASAARWMRAALPLGLVSGLAVLGIDAARGPTPGVLERPDGSAIWLARHDRRVGASGEEVAGRLLARGPGDRWGYAFGAGIEASSSPGEPPPPTAVIAEDPGLADAYVAGICFGWTLFRNGVVGVGVAHAVAVPSPEPPSHADAGRFPAACAAGIAEYVRYAVPAGDQDEAAAAAAEALGPMGDALREAWRRMPAEHLFARRVDAAELRARGLAAVGGRPAGLGGAAESGGETTGCGPPSEGGEASPDPTTLVVVHSVTGRTARVGAEIAAMLGAPCVRYRDAPPLPGYAPGSGGALAEVLPTLRLDGVRELYVGFPIWAEGPAPPALAFLERLDLAGIRVVPFYTFTHYAAPGALAALADAVRRRGGSTAPPQGFLFPLAATDDDVAAAAHRAILGRPDLWSRGRTARGPAPSPGCAPGPEAHGAPLCAVPEGDAWLGDDGSPGSPRGYPPPRRVRVPAFRVDRHEVTIAQYARCVDAGGCPPVALDSMACRPLGALEPELPLPCASERDARAYCGWAGLRLPTEAEWIRAARGESATPRPWGEDLGDPSTPLRANLGGKAGTTLPHYSLVPDELPWPDDGFPGLAPPCAFPAGESPFGACDLVGNLAEWVDGAPSPGPGWLKGGSWMDADPAALRIGSRASLSRDFGMYLTGFRCAGPAVGAGGGPPGGGGG
ncbi:formylglycine-generating enzyme family protein [Myxococcota bacterium]|nr:formylglycine-generating enzyme family protein [Myxococcota bacterium]